METQLVSRWDTQTRTGLMTGSGQLTTKVTGSWITYYPCESVNASQNLIITLNYRCQTMAREPNLARSAFFIWPVKRHKTTARAGPLYSLLSVIIQHNTLKLQIPQCSAGILVHPSGHPWSILSTILSLIYCCSCILNELSAH